MLTRRILALVVLLAALAGVAWLGAQALGSSSESAPPPPPPAPPPPKPLRIIFPEGFTAEEMAQRITAVNQIAREKRDVKPKLREAEYARLTRRSKLPGQLAGDKKPRPLEGFLFPATYEFLPKTTTKQLVNKQLVAFNRAWDELDLRYAKSKKLTPYDVLIIASMVEKETLAPDERPKVAAVIYNRLKAGMTLGIDATLRYGLDIPRDRVDPAVAARLEQPVQHAQAAWAAADADREPGPRLDAGRRPSGEGGLPLLRAEA